MKKALGREGHTKSEGVEEAEGEEGMTRTGRNAMQSERGEQ